MTRFPAGKEGVNEWARHLLQFNANDTNTSILGTHFTSLICCMFLIQNMLNVLILYFVVF